MQHVREVTRLKYEMERMDYEDKLKELRQEAEKLLASIPPFLGFLFSYRDSRSRKKAEEEKREYAEWLEAQKKALIEVGGFCQQHKCFCFLLTR